MRRRRGRDRRILGAWTRSSQLQSQPFEAQGLVVKAVVPLIRLRLLAEEFGPSGEIRVCLQSMDQRTKTFNFFFDIQNQPKVIKGTGVSMTHLNE